jgi:mRNA interferase ChpB
MSKILQRGDIINLAPTLGKEQQGRRYALVLTIAEFNCFGLALIAPITTGGNFARMNGFTVPLLGDLKVRGVVLSNQIGMVDYVERDYKIIEKCPIDILEDVLAKVQALVDFE